MAQDEGPELGCFLTKKNKMNKTTAKKPHVVLAKSTGALRSTHLMQRHACAAAQRSTYHK